MPDEKEKFADTGEFAGIGVGKAQADETAGGQESPPADGQPGSAAAANAGEDKGEAGGNGQAGAGDQDDGSSPAKPDDEAGKSADKADEAPDKNHLPIENFAEVDLGLGDVAVDKAVMEAFGKTCVDLKLTPAQAAGLAQFQLKAIDEARVNLTQKSVAELGKEWGADAGKNQGAIVNLVHKVDEALGDDSFSSALQESGVACYASFARGLLAMCKMLGEDSLNAGGPSAGKPKEEKAIDGLMEVFGAARRH